MTYPIVLTAFKKAATREPFLQKYVLEELPTSYFAPEIPPLEVG